MAFSQYMNFSEDIWPETREKKKEIRLFQSKVEQDWKWAYNCGLTGLYFYNLRVFDNVFLLNLLKTSKNASYDNFPRKIRKLAKEKPWISCTFSRTFLCHNNVTEYILQNLWRNGVAFTLWSKFINFVPKLWAIYRLSGLISP